jgi:hypothetical protein
MELSPEGTEARYVGLLAQMRTGCDDAHVRGFLIFMLDGGSFLALQPCNTVRHHTSLPRRVGKALTLPKRLTGTQHSQHGDEAA